MVRILTVGTDLETSRRAVDLAQAHECLSAAIGVHPSRAATFWDDREQLEQLAASPEVCAIGEIGLDFFRDGIGEDLQKDVFQAQLEWAARTNLPVVVHNREADGTVLDLLRQTGCRGVLHCFSGDLDFAMEGLAAGMTLSFAGNITFKSAAPLREVARQLPDERLLIETDAPYLAPQAWRGQRNEPAYVSAVAGTLAEVRECSVDEIGLVASRNAGLLFGWDGCQT